MVLSGEVIVLEDLESVGVDPQSIRIDENGEYVSKVFGLIESKRKKKKDKTLVLVKDIG